MDKFGIKDVNFALPNHKALMERVYSLLWEPATCELAKNIEDIAQDLACDAVNGDYWDEGTALEYGYDSKQHLMDDIKTNFDIRVTIYRRR